MLHVNANESNEKSILHKEDTTIWQEGFVAIAQLALWKGSTDFPLGLFGTRMDETLAATNGLGPSVRKQRKMEVEYETNHI